MSCLLKRGVLSAALGAFIFSAALPQTFAQEEEEESSPPQQQAQPEQGRVVPPVLIEDVTAEYTDEAVKARVEGQVILELTINNSGEVRDVKLVQGLGYGLDEAAIEAAKNFRFRPATYNGEPIAVSLNFGIQFSLPILPAEFGGRLADPTDDEGIGGARITLTYLDAVDEEGAPLYISDETDREGRFSFEELPPGTYEVTLEVEGYDSLSTTVELGDGESLEVEYALNRQADNVVGQIREAGTRTRLPGMELSLIDAETQETVRSDFSVAQGRFAFRGVPAGEYILRVSGPEHEVAIFDIDVADGEITSGNFYVRARDYDSLSVRTTAQRERSEVTRQTVQLEEVRRIPGTGGDVVRVVQNLPGVARPQFVGGQIIVRGSAPQDTGIFLEGDNVPLAFHFLGGPAVINTEMIQSIDFYPGNFSSRYGRSTAGIIDLRTRSPRTDRFHGYVDVDLLDSSAIIEGPINDNWSFALSGRRSYYDLFLPSVLRAFEADVFVAPRYYDYQAWTTYRSDDGDHKVEFSLYGSNDKLQLILPDNQPQGDTTVQTSEFGFDNGFHRGQARWSWAPEGSIIESDLMASFGVNMASIEVTEDLFFNLDYYTTQIRQDTRVELLEDLELRVGADAQIGTVRYSYAIPNFDASPDDTASPDGQGDIPANWADGMADQRATWEVLPAIYTELDYKLFDRVRLIPGLRADYYGPIRKVSISPRLTSRVDITDDLLIKGGVGLFTQPPLPGQAEDDFGNPNLTFEKAIHYALGAEWRPAGLGLEQLELDSTLFYRDNFDLVSTTAAQTIDEEGNRQPVVYDNSGKGRAFGLELLVRHHPHNNFFGWIAYTLSRSERLHRETGEWTLFNQDQTHILTLVAGYNLPWNIDISARFRLVSGNPITPVVGSVLDIDADSYRPVYGEPNSVRASAFHQLDLRVDKRFIFKTWVLAAYLDVLNVYNAVNQEGMRYNYDYTDSEPLRGLPILPTIGLSARF